MIPNDFIRAIAYAAFLASFVLIYYLYVRKQEFRAIREEKAWQDWRSSMLAHASVGEDE